MRLEEQTVGERLGIFIDFADGNPFAMQPKLGLIGIVRGRWMARLPRRKDESSSRWTGEIDNKAQ